MRGMAERLERIEASLAVAKRELEKHEDVHRECGVVKLCEAALSQEVVEIAKLADVLLQAGEPGEGAPEGG